MRYKVVGVLDILLGVLTSISQLTLLLTTYPKLREMYDSMNIPLPMISRLVPVLTIALLLLFLCTIFIGVKLLRAPTQKLFILGVVGLVTMLIFPMILTVLGITSPILNITTSI